MSQSMGWLALLLPASIFAQEPSIPQYEALSVCGDGVVEEGETCDDGNNAFGDGCSGGCKWELCGDGVQDAGEGCDDGNQISSDGCSSSCFFDAPGAHAGRGAHSDGGASAEYASSFGAAGGAEELPYDGCWCLCLDPGRSPL